MRVAQEGGIPRREVWKKFLRNFKKALDKRKRLWYNSQAVPPRAARSLKIEQQERLYKALQVRNMRSRQRVIYTQQSKRS